MMMSVKIRVFMACIKNYCSISRTSACMGEKNEKHLSYTLEEY